MKELIRVRVQYASRQQCCKIHKRPLPLPFTQALQAVVCVHWGVSKILKAVRVKRVYLPYFFLLASTLSRLHNHTRTPHSVSALDNKQHPQEIDIHAPSEFRTRNLSKRAAAGPHHRPRSPWDQPTCILRVVYVTIFDSVRHFLLKAINSVCPDVLLSCWCVAEYL